MLYVVFPAFNESKTVFVSQLRETAHRRNFLEGERELARGSTVARCTADIDTSACDAWYPLPNAGWCTCTCPRQAAFHGSRLHPPTMSSLNRFEVKKLLTDIEQGGGRKLANFKEICDRDSTFYGPPGNHGSRRRFRIFKDNLLKRKPSNYHTFLLAHEVHPCKATVEELEIQKQESSKKQKGKQGNVLVFLFRYLTNHCRSQQ